MSLQGFPGLHHLVAGEGFLLTLGNAGDYIAAMISMVFQSQGNSDDAELWC